MDVARINSAHGSLQQHQSMINQIRSGNKKYGHQVTILQDLAGYRIRVGELKKRKQLISGNVVYMSYEKETDENHIPFDYEDDLKLIKRGFPIFIDDGCTRLYTPVIIESVGELRNEAESAI